MNAYFRDALIGGGTDAVDSLTYASLSDGEVVWCYNGGTNYMYQWDSSIPNATGEASPDIIKPDDIASNDGAWILQSSPYDSLPVMASGVEAQGGMHGLDFALAADAEHDITVAIGSCKDSTNTSDIVLSSAMTKRIDATWVAATGNGGLMDNGILGGGVIADTIYDVYAILKDSDSSVDVVFVEDTDTLSVAGYTSFRWLGFVTTDSSANIIAFIMNGGWYNFLNASEVRIQTASTTNTIIDVSGLAPTERIEGIVFGAHSTYTANNNWVGVFADSGSASLLAAFNARYYSGTDDDIDSWGSTGVTAMSSVLIPFRSTLYVDITTDSGGTRYLLLRALKLKR